MLNQKTTNHYLDLLSQVFLINPLRPCHSNRNCGLVKTPKLHVADTGLLANILKMDKQQRLKDKEPVGQFFETFVYDELLRLAGWYEQVLQLLHYCDNDQYEVDMDILNEEGKILGVEVKLAVSVSEMDFRGLKHLQRQYPKKFIGRHVFYDVERVLLFDDGLYALELQCLWSAVR